MAVATATATFFCYVVLFSLLAVCSPSVPTVYEILPKYDLPSGLLPNSVKNYSISENGDFEVDLEKSCYIKFDYVVYYDKKITGKLSLGSISDLKGIEVQRFFLWLDVDQIRVDLPPTDRIYFTVGIINKELDVDQFEQVRSCQDKPSLTKFLQFPTPLNDIEMLLTE